MIKYRDGVNVIKALAAAGYNTGEIRRQRLFGENVLQKFRDGGLPSWAELDRLCDLLGVHPSDILQYVPGVPQEKKPRGRTVHQGTSAQARPRDLEPGADDLPF